MKRPSVIEIPRSRDLTATRIGQTASRERREMSNPTIGRTAIINWIRRHSLPAEPMASSRYRISREECLSWLKQRGMKVTEVVP